MRYFTYTRKSTESDDRQVLSIESQKEELRRAFAHQRDITIVRVYEESKSAKAPGRPIYDDMLKCIERGEADGIIAWHPDRLARNSIDGGRLIYLLDTGRLKDLKFANFTFENNPQGKLMLSVLFGFSKYYVDSLSENVKRGNRAKVERGWRPGNVPLGYRNDSLTKTIVPRQPHFDTIKRLLRLMQSGAYSVRTLLRIATVDWGYRLPEGKKYGGRPLAMSTMYKVLANPFYAGYFLWNGKLHKGAHESMISMEEYQNIQRVLGRKEKTKAHHHSFPFTGLLRCGVCGLMITAEHKVNAYGSRYTYYHCTKRGNGERCRQPSIDATTLSTELLSFVARIDISDDKHEEQIHTLATSVMAQPASNESAIQSAEKMIAKMTLERHTVGTMRARDHIDEAEYLARLRQLDIDIAETKDRLAKAKEVVDPLELGALLLSFKNRAMNWFVHGSDELKRMILKTIGSNYRLTDKKVSAEPAEPFYMRVEEPKFLYWWGVGDDIRTFELQDNTEKLKLMETLEKITAKAEAEGLDTAPLPLVVHAQESNRDEEARAA